MPTWDDSALRTTLTRHRVSRTRRGLMTIRIVVWQAEPIGQALRRLRKKLERSGVVWEVRRRKYPVDMTNQRRAKRFQKRFKARQSTLFEQSSGVQPVASLKEAKAQFCRRTG